MEYVSSLLFLELFITTEFELYTIPYLRTISYFMSFFVIGIIWIILGFFSKTGTTADFVYYLLCMYFFLSFVGFLCRTYLWVDQTEMDRVMHLPGNIHRNDRKYCPRYFTARDLLVFVIMFFYISIFLSDCRQINRIFNLKGC